MKLLPLTRLAIIGLTLYYSGQKQPPPWLQSSVIMSSLVALLDAANEVIEG